MSVISIKNLSVTYFLGKSNEVHALSNANLEINAGEFIIFFGSSGCGKSTLLYTIAGLEKPTEGSVKVNNVDLANMKNNELENYRQSTIGMVFQAFYLIPSLSIVKNIILPQMAVGVSPKKRYEEAERLMKYFGVYAQKDKLPNELSGGQQQRVAICRALVNNPEIIFADEPVGNLDSKSAQDVLGLIQELNIKNKKTVILVTHDPSHLDIADKVFFMKDGKIIDTKVNTQTRKIQMSTDAQHAPAQKTNLELVSHALTKDQGFGLGGMLLDFKVKEVVLDALTGLHSEELSEIEQQVKQILQHTTTADGYKKLERYLDTEYTFGGVGLDIRSAERLTAKIRSTVEELKSISAAAHRPRKKNLNYIERLRYHLLDTFNVHISSTDTIEAIENIIRDRVDGVTDRKGVQARFDMPLEEGGAGLDHRDAKKMAKHLELIMLGRYTLISDKSEVQQKKDNLL